MPQQTRTCAYLSEADYAALSRLVPNLQYVLECVDEALTAARRALKDKLERIKN
ncbi:hypothetical protein HDF16_006302 [Granulicella aggregans]|uniref:Uncharacterized protein n=1 Tax=Granulicella aggregans TaxID=474949 RepID=A0A7W7ZKF8_9BACT|nr:hypothetical protein [Granulicella aggregans]MBB5061566.1 hypothetical protein [Granulicella aggregans]